ncbi:MULTISPECIES: TIM barrel protein [unclassified Caballeronia]|uniref:hydroxypyruvate isomerase family protein n=1 Tax=unclassified Caballeronia TaxID=2646786 RepID=UPI00286126E4|nr:MULTISPECIES: TIM barrel protein [unclassified Caballeronia]MDR5774217.1 TIM barrel protein [Caballeronia sp. LZ002]MDR5849652.1 TIM barrel protein [Caballeronia sp. LZ003]
MQTSNGTSLRFCANLKWLFTELPFLERFEAAAKQGFSAVEYASPYEFEPAILKATLDATGLRQVLINTPAAPPGSIGSSGFGCIPGERARYRDGVLRALHYASALKCGLIHVMAGLAPGGVPVEQVRDTLRENLAWAADAARDSGVTLLLECLNQIDVPGYALRSLEEAHALMKEIAQPKLRLLFDAYHCRMSGLDVVEQFALYAPDVAHIQFADAPGRHEPGTGDMPWNELIASIRAQGYEGWIGCEYRPRESTVAGLGWLNAFKEAP